jgi:hypothetical protein
MQDAGCDLCQNSLGLGVYYGCYGGGAMNLWTPVVIRFMWFRRELGTYVAYVGEVAMFAALVFLIFYLASR